MPNRTAPPSTGACAAASAVRRVGCSREQDLARLALGLLSQLWQAEARAHGRGGRSGLSLPEDAGARCLRRLWQAMSDEPDTNLYRIGPNLLVTEEALRNHPDWWISK